MKYEKSCGALCLAPGPGAPRVLMVKHVAGGHWAFPKGHLEQGETEEQTAVREVLEETGVAITLLPGFRETTRYSPRRGISKQVVYFLARAKTDTPNPQPEEILEARFVPLAEALTLLTYNADRGLLQKAEQFAQLL